MCEQIRDTPWGENMLLVAITGWGQESDKRTSASAGFDAHLTKPIDPSQLLVKLKAIAHKLARLH